MALVYRSIFEMGSTMQTNKNAQREVDFRMVPPGYVIFHIALVASILLIFGLFSIPGLLIQVGLVQIVMSGILGVCTLAFFAFYVVHTTSRDCTFLLITDCYLLERHRASIVHINYSDIQSINEVHGEIAIAKFDGSIHIISTKFLPVKGGRTEFVEMIRQQLTRT